jgi:hypothetical protein
MTGGKITVQKVVPGNLVVNITRTDAVALVVKNEAGSTVTMPDTLSDVASKTYVVPANTKYTISVKRNDVEIANTPEGTRIVEIVDGQVFTFAPSPDATSLASVTEVGAAAQASQAAAGWIVLPSVELDEEDAPVDGPTGVPVIAWDSENDELIYWDGSAWSTVAVVTP